MDNKLHVVIVGAGFGGLYAAKRLSKNKNINVTVIDKRNFHLFQPLLYQVATGGLSPGDIASPIRSILKKYSNTTVLRGKVVDIEPDNKTVLLMDGELIHYDTLIIATGVRYNYFGNEEWLSISPPLKTMEDSLGIRHRIFKAFEEAEREKDIELRKQWMRFIIIGAGPTGVELAGALGELAHFTLKNNFRNYNPKDTEIILIEADSRILPSYPEKLSNSAEKSLKSLGVTIKKNTYVGDLKQNEVIIKNGEVKESIKAKTILWAAGVKATKIGEVIKNRFEVDTDKVGRVYVNKDLSIDDNDDVFVIGDLALFTHQNKSPLPGVAPVAIQQGKYIAEKIINKQLGKSYKAFTYKDKGSLAVIGRNKAVADLGFIKINGFLAWLIWIFLHIRYLIEFDNKVLVMIQWGWYYLTMKRGARLITGDAPFPYLDKDYYSHTKDG
ncbi:MAG: NAD(P)/FAD-dependent oxidoreductase [Thermodesulfobacteriota bacterium]